MRDERKLIRNIKYRQDREAANEPDFPLLSGNFRYAFRQTGDQELAMDLTQEIPFCLFCGESGI